MTQEIAAARVQVLLPLPLPTLYDYAVPDGLALGRGDVVAVPFGRRQVIGVVWGAGGGEIAEDRLKPVAARIALPGLPPVMLDFIDWVAAYTLAPPGQVLRMALSVSGALRPPRPVTAHAALPPGREPPVIRLTPARRRVLALLADSPPLTLAALCREAAVGPGVVKALASAGAIETVALPPAPDVLPPDPARPGPVLDPDQAAAAAALRQGLRAGGFQVSLLDGETGSGKTEVYFEAIAESLRQGRQALVLLPEIALSAQWLARFEARFGTRPAEWHSDLAASRRHQTWRAAIEGTARVVVGARSALFLPFADLGLIVVDEEHDSSYKQDDGVRYQARDMAVVRARLGGHPLILASATPSLETVVNVARGRYRSLSLPRRHGGAPFPAVRAVDLRRDRPARGRWLAPALVGAMTETLAAGQQALLFLNRRGYAPLTLCRDCGHRFECPDCTAWLVEHRLLGRLVCHHCGRRARVPARCPACDSEGSLVASGPGIERVAEEVAARFPDARLALVSSDSLRGPAAAGDFVRRVTDGEVDIIIGTQIVAKGHHFPDLTLVGVVDADLGLNGGDLRAAERTYQLLHQVAGRAGRAGRPGRVLLQTHDPENPVMRALAAGDRAGFLAHEQAARQRAGMPPHGRLAALIVSAGDARQADEVAGRLARTAPRAAGISVLGPAPAPLALLRGRHRRRLLVKAARGVRLQPHLRDWLSQVPIPAAVRVAVDIDPYSFM